MQRGSERRRNSRSNKATLRVTGAARGPRPFPELEGGGQRVGEVNRQPEVQVPFLQERVARVGSRGEIIQEGSIADREVQGSVLPQPEEFLSSNSSC